MAGNFTYLSVVSTVATSVRGGTHGYVQFLNLDWIPGVSSVTTTASSGGSTYTTAAGGAPVSVNGSTGAIVITGGSNVTVSNGANVISIVAADGDSVARSDRWAALGVAVSSVSPGPGVQYSQWTAGSAGYWAWALVP